jgi:hypothetical protein
MIKNYSRPQSVIRQNLEVLDLADADEMNAFVYGPAYSLHRYTNEAERSEMVGTDFTTAEHTLEYEGLGLGETVVGELASIYGEDLRALLAEFSAQEFKIKGIAESNVLVYDETVTGQSGAGVKAVGAGEATAVTVLDTRFHGRDVQVGDLVEVNVVGGEQRLRTVTAVEAAVGSPTVSDAADYPANVSSNSLIADNVSTAGGSLLALDARISTWNLDATEPVIYADGNFTEGLLEAGSVYNGKLGDRFTLTCIAGGNGASGAVFSVSSASGSFSDTSVTLSWIGGSSTQALDLSNIGGTAKGFIIEFAPDGGTDETWIVGDQIVLDIFGDYEVPAYTGADVNIEVSSTDYSGSIATTYFVKVKEGAEATAGTYTGAELEITDSAGLEVIQTISNPVSGTEYNLGTKGLTFTLYETGKAAGGTTLKLKKDEVYTVNAEPSAKTAESTNIVLDGNAFTNTNGIVPQVSSIKFYKAVNGLVPNEGPSVANPPFTFGEDEVTVDADLSVEDTLRDAGYTWLPLVDGEGKLFVSYKALQAVSVTDEIVQISSTSDIVDNFGTIDPENTLAYGALMCLSGANGKDIYAGAVATDDADGFTEVLRQAENMQNLYAHAPLSYDSNVLAVVDAHVNAMSTEYKKQWRRAYVSTDTTDGSFIKVGKQSDGSNNTCTITDDGDGNFIKLYSTTVNFIDEDIKTGDLIRVNFGVDAAGDETYEEYEIALVTSKDEVLLKGGVATQLFVPVRFEVWAADNGKNQAERVAAVSSSYGSRRVINVWCDAPEILIDGQYEKQEMFYVAAEIAGLRTALLPQQGLTYTEIASISRAKSMYTKYTQEELDIAAASGTFIITQERKGGAIFIRHQLTTETDKGSLYYEDSVGVNIDEISFAVKAQDLKYIGKRNATNETVREIKIDFENLMIEKSVAPTFQSIGPQIVEVIEGSLVVEIDDTFKDRINRSVKVSIPLPLNRLETDLNFTTILD